MHTCKRVRTDLIPAERAIQSCDLTTVELAGPADGRCTWAMLPQSRARDNSSQGARLWMDRVTDDAAGPPHCYGAQSYASEAHRRSVAAARLTARGFSGAALVRKEGFIICGLWSLRGYAVTTTARSTAPCRHVHQTANEAD